MVYSPDLPPAIVSTKKLLFNGPLSDIFPLNGSCEILFLFPGGAPESFMDAATYRPGLVGCILEFSVGNIASIDMLGTAANTRNVDICHK